MLIMRTPRLLWVALCCIWMCLVFFSSTSLARQWADLAFHVILVRSNISLGARDDLLYLFVDKGLHVFMFTVLAVLFSQVFTTPSLRIKAMIFVMCGITGMCTEAVQAFFPDRDPAIRDVFINAAGAVLGIVVNAQLVGRPPS
jgi:VanZ family protein